jgi:UDP-N-acetylglucosamine 1-carboxyvinyltransferase
MSNSLIINQSLNLKGTVNLSGAKNAVLVEMAATLLAEGISILKNVPASEDVFNMILLLEDLGAKVDFDLSLKTLKIDTALVNNFQVSSERMKKMRASILVLGPLLVKFLRARLALPGGCSIGSRPVDYHIKNFQKLGVKFNQEEDFLYAFVEKFNSRDIFLDYPSVGATENILMAATLIEGQTKLINAALEPEVLDLVEMLKKMGADIEVHASATILINGVKELKPVMHEVVLDRLEAGSLLLATAVTVGSIKIPKFEALFLEGFLYKLEEMGHSISTSDGIELVATYEPKSVSIKTHPYPGFPTDLQAPMMVAQCIASGESIIEETVFENRMLHAHELNKMGANIKVKGNTAFITGVKKLSGANVLASDIRASCALVTAGLVAQGTTIVEGLHHFRRGYDALDKKLQQLGAHVKIN